MSARRGLVSILGATAVAGGLGYLLQALVPIWLSEPTEYLTFSVFWATLFLLVSMASGVQQEVSRAVRPGLPASGRHSGSVLFRTAAVILLVVAVLVPVIFGVLGTPLFGYDTGQLAAAMGVGLGGYVGVALISGVFYGVGAFDRVAVLNVIEAALRLILVILSLTFGFGLVPAAYAVAVPFGLAALISWAMSSSVIVGRFSLDSGVLRLLRNMSQTMLAALATGVLISGLPTLLRLFSAGIGEQSLAALVLSLTLTRAPLVVPLLALQSYLVVTYRRLPPARAIRRALFLLAGVFGLTGAVAVLTWAVGPGLLRLMYAEQLVLDGGNLALVLLGGGATAGLCVIAPALLAHELHAKYLAGWLVAAVVTVLVLLWGSATLTTTIVSLIPGPLSGIIVHLVFLGASRRPDRRE